MSEKPAQNQPVFVLVRPQMGENIGAAARGMLNFGLTRLSLVAPRDGWPSKEAVAMASGAGRVLDDARLFGTAAEALAEAQHVYATTARVRGLTKRILSPEAAMSETAAALGRGEKVAFLFGPERAGLDNDDIARASAIVNFPTNPDYSSLNLGQCVNLLSYEWRRASAPMVAESAGLAGADPATGIEIDKLAEHFEARLDAAQYFFPADKAPVMKRSMRNFFSRASMTRADVQMLHGIMRAMVRWKERG